MNKQLTRLPYILCYLCAFVLGMKQLREPDIWWQLLSGRWMAENNAITRTDEFSYTMQGVKWVNVKWLYEVLIAAIERALGPHGVMLLQSLVNVAIVLILLRLLFLVSRHLGKQVSILYSVVALLLFLAISEFRMAGRPEMVSHLLTATYMLILWQSPGFAWKRIIWLIPLQCLWANMHEAYPVGMAIIGTYVAGSFVSYAIGRDKQVLQSGVRLAIAWAGMALAILANPNGIQLWKQPFEIFRQLRVNQYTTELFSVAEPEYWNVQGKAHIILLAAVLVFWLVRLVIDRKQLGNKISPLLWGYLLTLPLLGYLSLTANRNIPFAQIALFPSLPLMFPWLAERLKLVNREWYAKASKRTVLISCALAAAFYLTIVSNKYYGFTKSPNKYGLHLSPLDNPVTAAEFIRTWDVKGPAFSDYFVSSYLLYALYPDFKSYIDLRDLDIFPAKFFDEYFDIYNDPEKFNKLDSVYKFNYIVLATSQLTSLQQYLYWREGFNVVHIDPVAVILLRTNEQNQHLNQGPAAQKLFTWPQETTDPGWAEALTKMLNPTVSYEKEDELYMPIHAAKFYNMVRNTRMALRFLRPAVQTDFAEDAEALATIGLVYKDNVDMVETEEQKKKMLDSAHMYLHRSLELSDKIPNAHFGLALMALNQGDFDGAKQHLEKYIELEKSNDYIYYLAGICARNLWQSGRGDTPEEVVEYMKESVRLNKRNTRAYLYMAEAYWAMGDRDKARECMRNTLSPGIPWMAYEKELHAKMKSLTGITQAPPATEMVEHDHAGHSH